MVKCSTLGKMFHEKGAQNNGEKNKVKRDKLTLNEGRCDL
jgi:hypothetical protein